MASLVKAALLSLVFATFANKAQAQIDTLPSMDDVKLQFGTGLVQNNLPQISPIQPAIPGPTSGWKLIQWQQSTEIKPNHMSHGDVGVVDSALGQATYSFYAADRHADLRIFQQGSGGHPVYELDERDGWVTTGGGSNLFLSADTRRPAPNLAQKLRLSMLAKISNASIHYDSDEAKQKGAVLGMAFAGLVIQFPSPGGISTLFMQLPLANSHNGTVLSIRCTMHNGRYTLLSGGLAKGSVPLPFSADPGPLHRLDYNINAQWAAIAAKPLKCHGAGGEAKSVDLNTLPPANVTVRGIYVGLETENTDKRLHRLENDEPQGNVAMGLQLTNVQLLANS